MAGALPGCAGGGGRRAGGVRGTPPAATAAAQAGGVPPTGAGGWLRPGGASEKPAPTPACRLRGDKLRTRSFSTCCSRASSGTGRRQQDARSAVPGGLLSMLSPLSQMEPRIVRSCAACWVTVAACAGRRATRGPAALPSRGVGRWGLASGGGGLLSVAACPSAGRPTACAWATSAMASPSAGAGSAPAPGDPPGCAAGLHPMWGCGWAAPGCGSPRGAGGPSIPVS